MEDTDNILQGSQLPCIDRPIDNTALTAYLACPREYFLSMVLHRREKGRSAALTFGSAWHKALEIHYLTDGDVDAVQAGVTAAWEGHDSADDYRTLPRVLHDYNLYVREYGIPSRESAKTVGWPHQPLVELSTNAQAEGLLHPWAGKLDRFIRIGGLVYLEDHKTTSRFDKNYWKQFGLSYQMMGYTFLGKQLLPGESVAGVRINLSHVLTNKTQFHHQLFTFTPQRMAEWVDNTNMWLIRLNRDYERLNELREEFGSYEEIPETRVSEAFPMHWGDNGCSRKFGMCRYHAVCSIGPHLRRQMLEREFEIKVWNPLEVDDE